MFSKIVVTVFTMLAFLSGVFGAGFTADEAQANQIKNVIIMIGDGMGYNHIYATQDRYDITSAMLSETEYQGYSETRSASSLVTDSAAGGTALATGERTMNGCVGTYFLDQRAVFAEPASITEVAIKYDMNTGIVTSDTVTGATPASFSAHESSRDMYDEIFEDQLESDIDLIWGSVDHAVVSQSQCQQKGKKYITTLSQAQALEPGEQSIGQFHCETLWQGNENGDNPTLSELTEQAINLLSADDKGFFLMVEGAHIDKRSHANDIQGATMAVLEFDKAVGEAISFAKESGNTLVIITADHETGKLRDDGNGNYTWKTDGHSSTDVPLLVYGSDSFMKDGETVKNKEIPDRAVAFMTKNQQYFPCAVDYLNK